MKLFCFPYAGGTAEAIQKWLEPLAQETELIPVRYASGALDFNDFIHELYSRIKAHLTEDTYAFFGHSFGSLVAFEITGRLKQEGLNSPSVLILSGKRPLIYDNPQKRHLLSDEELYQEIIQMGGFPDHDNDERLLLRLFLHKVRAQLKMSETYKYTDHLQINSDMILLNGTEDPETDADEMEDWSLLTTGTCEIHHFKGNHFFFYQHQNEITKLIQHRLAKYSNFKMFSGGTKWKML